MNRTNEEELLKKYRDRQCSEAELEQLHAWYADWHIEDRAMLSEAELIAAETKMRAEVTDRLGFPISPSDLQDVPLKNSRLWPRITILAAAIAAIIFGVWLFSGRSSVDEITYANDIAAGKNKATLTLPNGKTVELSEAKTGVVIDAAALTYADGTPVAALEDKGGDGVSSIQMMAVQTPKGGTYQVILPDGTKVWLNAASSIKFPSRFTGEKRSVTTSGEIYFEVAKDPSRPFVVSCPDQELEVLGTHFNLNSYADNSEVKTTLLEGSVKVNGNLLKPGQQSILKAEGIEIKPVDVDEIIAWKEGNFRFVDENVTEIMKHIARWYNVDIVYEDDVSAVRLNAAISRNRNVSQVLKMMEKTNEVHFKIEGRKIIVEK